MSSRKKNPYKQRNASLPQKKLFLSLANIRSLKLFRLQAVGKCCQSHCVMTSVCKSRGILSLDKHVALSAAVAAWNGSWHKVAPTAKNNLWRYTTERGKIQGGEF